MEVSKVGEREEGNPEEMEGEMEGEREGERGILPQSCHKALWQ